MLVGTIFAHCNGKLSGLDIYIIPLENTRYPPNVTGVAPWIIIMSHMKISDQILNIVGK